MAKRGRYNNTVPPLKRTESIMFPSNNMNMNNMIKNNNNINMNNNNNMNMNINMNNKNKNNNNKNNNNNNKITRRNRKISRINNAINVTSKKQKSMSNKTIRKLENSQKRYRNEAIKQAARNLVNLKTYNISTQKNRKTVHGNFPEEIHEFGLTSNNIQRGITTTRHRYRNEKAFAEQQIQQIEEKRHINKWRSIYNFIKHLLSLYTQYKPIYNLTEKDKQKIVKGVKNIVNNHYGKGEHVNATTQYDPNKNTSISTDFVDNPYKYILNIIFKKINIIYPNKNNNGNIIFENPVMNDDIYSEILQSIVYAYYIYGREQKLQYLPQIEDEELISIIFNTQ